MLARSLSEIDSPMDASLEIEEGMQGIDLNEDFNDAEEIEDGDDDEDLLYADNKPLEVFNIDTDLPNVELPAEVTGYINSLSNETRKLEEELKECDDLLNYSPRKPHVSTALVVYDDLKEIEQAAAEVGMSAEDFTQKVLNDLKENEFNEEEVDKEYEEFLQLQKEFAELRADVTISKSSEHTKVLAIEGPPDASHEEALSAVAPSGAGMVERFDSETDNTEIGDASESTALVKYDGPGADHNGSDTFSEETSQIVLMSTALTSMRDFILEQLRQSEELYEKKRQSLSQSIETLRHEEEREMMRNEERKRKLEDQLCVEREALRQRRETNESELEEELKARQEHTTEELNKHQTEIDRLSAALAEERHQFEVNQKQWQHKLAETRGKAAIKIQKVYRGMSTRKRHSREVSELAELRELRVKERHTLRLMEVEYEMKVREEQAKRAKEEEEKKSAEEKMRLEEEERQREMERKKKEEEEKIAEEARKEKERLEMEAKQAEIKRKKEEEEQQKLEEKRRKEEEKKQKEEEKKRQKEEEKRKKEEEKKRKEEEKKKKQAEKRRKEEEEKKHKQEEKEQKEKAAEEKQTNESVQSNGVTVQNLGNADSKKIYENFISQGDGNCKTATGTEEALEPTTATEPCSSSSSEAKTLPPSETQPLKESLMLAAAGEPSDTTAPSKPSPSEERLAETPIGIVAKVNTSTTLTYPMPSNENIPVTTAEEKALSASPVPQGAAFKTSTLSSSSSSSVQHSKHEEAATPPSKPANSSPALPPQPVLQAPQTPEPKPNPAELQRLAWMKSCIPWSKVSNEPWKLSQTTAKVHKKPASAKKLPAVAESVVLAAAHAETLRQVSAVTLSELPGCSLSTLSQCWSLRYLTVTHCGLLCLDGLSQCRHLLYIDAEHNHIEYVDLKDLGSLQVIKLSHNNLSSVHGLEGCINLRWLNVSHNSITRIGPGLSALRRLHTLDLSHNQLVSAQGLECVVTCQRLLLEHNYLQSVDSLDKICLLTELSLAANNLLKVPELKNHVLLQTLNLEENSIKSLEAMRNHWLPLLTALSCGKNLLESCEGLDHLALLEVLDIGSNQIVDLDSLTRQLGGKHHLTRLVVKGNPFVDVCGDKYSAKLATALPSLIAVDSLQTNSDKAVEMKATEAEKEWVNEDFLRMCQSQIRQHTQLKTEFDMNVRTLLANKSATPETLCGTYFSFCDTSFKMASEHRSAHEYGDISLSRSTGNFAGDDRTEVSQSKPKPAALNGRVDGSKSDVDKRHAGDMSKFTNGQSSVLDKKALFDQAVIGQSSVSSAGGLVSAQSSQDQSLTSSGVISSRNDRQVKQPGILHTQQAAHKLISSHTASTHFGQKSGATAHLPSKGKLSSRKSKPVISRGSSSQSDSDSDADSDGYDATGGAGSARSLNAYTHVPRPPGAPPVVSYANEKDKFELALNSTSGGHKNASSHGPFVNGSPYMSEKERFEMALKHPGSSSHKSGRDKFDTALHSTSTDAKDKFDTAFQKSTGTALNQRPGMPSAGVPANIVGSQLANGNEGFDDDFDLGAFGLEHDLDLDNLDFDIDKYLDMEALDEFLEKGWRPEESPQIPHSSYPVLGKINPAGDTTTAAAASSHTSSNSNHNNVLQGKPPVVPPHHPTLAWRNSPASAELRGRPLQSPSSGVGGHAGITSLPVQPSPSPSSVASAAETLGGGTVKSKKDELLDEWGFKDSRTAEMMIARAKKMKWNAERRKKLNKLDPQQRLHLFRKLEESGKIQSVRPPPARVLPRKEYFQAREDEAHRQHLERQVEEQAKVHRTYEWLHTQVGDHPIASSRINGGQGSGYAMNDAGSGRQMVYKAGHDSNRKWSPGSDHLDSVSLAGSKPRQGRRYSIGDSQYSGQTPSLPPIQVGSAPSSHKGERISFRDNPVEKSGGWGGGKRRGNRKQ